MLPRDRAREAYGGVTMSDYLDGTEDAKTAIRAAVQYLLKESSGSDRGDIVREIIEMVKEVVRGDDALLRPIRRCTRRVGRRKPWIVPRRL